MTMLPYRDPRKTEIESSPAPFDYGAQIEREQRRVAWHTVVLSVVFFSWTGHLLPSHGDPMLAVIALVGCVMVALLSSLRIATGTATSAVNEFEEQMMERYRKRSHKKRR